jgi:hypothetical protein
MRERSRDNMSFDDEKQVALAKTKEAENKGVECLEAAKKYVCKSDADLAQCQGLFKFIKARQKEIKEELSKDLEPLITKLNDAHKSAVSLRKKALDPWERAEAAIENIMRPYTVAKLQREDVERRGKEEAAKKQAELDKELAALEAEIDGASLEAQLIRELPAAPKRVTVQSTAKQVEGFGIKRPWIWRVINENLIPDEYWILDEKKISEIVRFQKEKTNIGGIEAYQDVKFSG